MSVWCGYGGCIYLASINIYCSRKREHRFLCKIAEKKPLVDLFFLPIAKVHKVLSDKAIFAFYASMLLIRDERFAGKWHFLIVSN